MQNGLFIGDIDKLVFNIGRPFTKETTLNDLKRNGFTAKYLNKRNIINYAKYVAKYPLADPDNVAHSAPAETHLFIRVFKSINDTNAYWKERYANPYTAFKPYNDSGHVYTNLKHGSEIATLVFIEKNILIEIGIVEAYGDISKTVANLANNYPAWLKKRTSTEFINKYN
jgi:hypothetical protein